MALTVLPSVTERYALMVVTREVARGLTGTNPHLEECVG
jgi:hypothetical protein